MGCESESRCSVAKMDLPRRLLWAKVERVKRDEGGSLKENSALNSAERQGRYCHKSTLVQIHFNDTATLKEKSVVDKRKDIPFDGL